MIELIPKRFLWVHVEIEVNNSVMTEFLTIGYGKKAREGCDGREDLKGELSCWPIRDLLSYCRHRS